MGRSKGNAAERRLRDMAFIETLRQKSGVDNLIPHICGAMTRKGTPCVREPIPGGARCHFHGGGAPVTLRSARLRLLEMAEPAFHVLQDILEDEFADDDLRLKAAIAVLDRAGLGPKQTIILENRKEELAQLTDAELIARMQALLRFQKAPGTIDVTPINPLDAPFGEQPLLPVGVTSDDQGKDPDPATGDPWIERVGDSPEDE